MSKKPCNHGAIMSFPKNAPAKGFAMCATCRETMRTRKDFGLVDTAQAEALMTTRKLLKEIGESYQLTTPLYNRIATVLNVAPAAVAAPEVERDAAVTRATTLEVRVKELREALETIEAKYKSWRKEGGYGTILTADNLNTVSAALAADRQP